MKRLLCVLCLLVWTRPAAAAIAFVSGATCSATCGTGSAGTIATTALSTSTGNFAVAGFRLDSAATKCNTVTSTSGTTWHLGKRLANAGGFFDVWYAYNLTGNASEIVTCAADASSTYGAASILQFSGLPTTCDSLLDGQSASGSGTTVTSPTVSAITTTVITAFAQNFFASGTWTAGTGYTLTQFSIPGDGIAYFMNEYHIVTASEAASATTVNTGAWDIVATSFRDTCPAGGGASSLLLLGVGR